MNSESNGNIEDPQSQNAAEEGNDNTATSMLSKSDSMPTLQPLLALPAPSDWKINNENHSDVMDENDHKYVGLTNQCQTCYLNSLIQTLYMVPEFRNTIYTIEPKANSKGIHHQLQKLFVQLQTCSKTSLPTVDLTESFGWQNEQLYQHDVQELFRVLIEALENRWEKTPHKGCIETLFKGDIIDYVKCLKCGTVKVKPDIFLDLSLAIKPDGGFKPYKSLEESMAAFIKPEILDGNNKYMCDNCNSHEDAEKGLGIKKFPSILAIQLKRYGFDPHTFHRIKLNDRLTFPDFLDLNSYLYKEPEPPKPKMSYAQIVSKPSTSTNNEDQSPPLPNDKNDRGWWSLGWSNLPYFSADDSGWLDENCDSENVQKMLEKGPYIYELFSVLIHQGSANGGHYYAYIKNLDQQRWFCFNDSTVSNATIEDVKRTFGGTSAFGTNSPLGFQSSNAYMLMYRRIDSLKNENFIRTINLPEHMKLLLKQIEKDEQEIAIQRKLEKERVNVHFICNDRSAISENPIDMVFHKDIAYSDLLHELCSHYNSIIETDCRLIKCNSNWEMECEFDRDSEPPLNHIHRTSFYRPESYIMIDTKQGSHFYDLPPSNSIKTADVHLVDLNNQVSSPAKRVCFDPSMTVADLKGHLCVIPEVRVSDPLRLRIVFDAFQDRNQPMTLWDDDQIEIRKLARLIRGENLQLFIDVGSTECLERDRSIEKYENTLMHAILERKKYNQRLFVWLPTEDDFIKANLPVPDFQNLSDEPQPPQCGRVDEEEESGEGKLSVDDTDSSTSADFVEKDTNDSLTDFVPQDPFQKCSVAKLNIDTPAKDFDNGIASVLSASSTYSSTNSSAPPPFVPNEIEPLDPEQMEVLIKTSSSAFEEGPPPPPYTELDNEQQPSTSNQTETVDINLENDQDDNLSLACGETPKRSPNVSDDEGCKTAAFVGGTENDNVAVHSNYTQFDHSNTNENMDFDMFFPDRLWDRLPGPSQVVDCSRIQILDKSYDDCVKLELSVDRRKQLKNLHEWLASYLNVDKANIQIFKFYREHGDGFAVNLHSSTETVHTTLSDIDHICVKLHVVDENQKSSEDRTFIKGRDHIQSSTQSQRHERQLRIKLASESEP